MYVTKGSASPTKFIGSHMPNKQTSHMISSGFDSRQKTGNLSNNLSLTQWPFHFVDAKVTYLSGSPHFVLWVSIIMVNSLLWSPYLKGGGRGRWVVFNSVWTSHENCGLNESHCSSHSFNPPYW